MTAFPSSLPSAPVTPREQGRGYTLKSIATGGILGMLLAVANLYVGIRVGIGFSVNIVACLLAFTGWSVLRGASGGRITGLSVPEMACLSSTASSAGSATGSVVAVTFGALMILDAQHAHRPWWVVTAFTATTALLGVFVAIGLRRQLLAQEGLAFPTATATAASIRTLYERGGAALRMTSALAASFTVSVIIAVLNVAEGQIALLDRFFTWMKAQWFAVRIPDQVPESGFALLAGKPLLGFGFEPSTALLGLGMIVGSRVAFSMLGASALLYLVIAPWLQGLDAQAAGQADHVLALPLAGGGAFFHPLRWSLWGGTSLLLGASLASLALDAPILARALVLRRRQVAGPAIAVVPGDVPVQWMWMGLLPIGLALLALEILAFGISVSLGLVSLAMCLLVAMVAARCAAETDIAPTGAMGKLMQLIFALITPAGAPAGVLGSQNVLAAGVAGNTAMGASDLVSDFKLGQLLGTSPRQQFAAQLSGVVFGVIAVVPAWYALVPNYEALEKYAFPAAQIWAAVAKALTLGLSNLPASARLAIVVGGLIGAAIPVLERSIPRLRPYLPSPAGLGLGWVVMFSTALSIGIGAAVALAWGRLAPGSQTTYRVPLASGFIAGESLARALLALIVMGVTAGS